MVGAQLGEPWLSGCVGVGGMFCPLESRLQDTRRGSHDHRLVFDTSRRWIFLGESLTTASIVGGLVIVAGVVLANTEMFRRLK